MEPLLAYGHPLGSSMGLIAALEWLGQPYRLTRIDMLGEMREPPYLALNPRVETPVLVTPDDEIITETMAILDWIAKRDTERRISFDPDTPEWRRLLQIAAFINTGFTGAFSAYWVALEMDAPEPAYQGALRRFGREAVHERHRKLETLMGDTPYLLGDHPTLADGIFIGIARWADFHQAVTPGAYPGIDALKARLNADPAVVYATAIEDGEQPVGTGAMKGQVPLADLLARIAA